MTNEIQIEDYVRHIRLGYEGKVTKIVPGTSTVIIVIEQLGSLSRWGAHIGDHWHTTCSRLEVISKNNKGGIKHLPYEKGLV